MQSLFYRRITAKHPALIISKTSSSVEIRTPQIVSNEVQNRYSSRQTNELVPKTRQKNGEKTVTEPPINVLFDGKWLEFRHCGGGIGEKVEQCATRDGKKGVPQVPPNADAKVGRLQHEIQLPHHGSGVVADRQA